MRLARPIPHWGKLTLGLILALGSLSACGNAAPGQAGPTATPPATLAVPSAATATPPPPPAAGQTATAPASGPTAPADPLTVFNPLNISNPEAGNVLVKSDILDLNGSQPNEALLTVNVPPVISDTSTVPPAQLSLTDTTAALLVAGWDATKNNWRILYQTPDRGVPGRAVPLPAAAQGQNLLGASPALPVLQLRTESAAPEAPTQITVTLRLYAWKDGTVKPLTMQPAGGNAGDAVFSGKGDVRLMDMDNDGRAEVIVDDGAKTQIWKWDGNNFVPR